MISVDFDKLEYVCSVLVNFEKVLSGSLYKAKRASEGIIIGCYPPSKTSRYVFSKSAPLAEAHFISLGEAIMPDLNYCDNII